MNHRRISKLIGLLCLGFLIGQPAAKADETGGTGSVKVLLSGQFSHSKVQKAKVQGAPAGSEAAFHQEIFGSEFTLSILGIPAGHYQVVVGLVENAFGQAGSRVFDITCGTNFLAKELDIYNAAGGRAKVLLLTNTIDFTGETGHGPLAFTFIAQENNAKFNTFELSTAGGQSLVSLKAADFASTVEEDPAARQVPGVTGPEIWRDYTKPTAERIQDLVSRLSLVEKVSQLSCDSPAIPRLNIPAYSYRNECLHGLAPHDGFATVFPQAIGMAATWDPALIREEADVIATEARATHNDYVAKHNGESLIHFGLNFYTPNINIFRDPRWGRGQETYGEDPFLTGRMAVDFIAGLQGTDPKYYKTIAGVKHFAVHSGPESERHRFNAEPSERDLYETYLPAFETSVKEGQVDSLMGAYSSLYGVPCCANTFLLTDLLRKQWGFKGFVVSDGGAIFDINNHHKFVPTAEQAAAAAVKAGDDMCSGGGKEYDALTLAVKLHMISETEINAALSRALEARFRLGLFDPAEQVPFAQIPISQNDTPEHEAVALKVARESMVLLKNTGILPLDRSKLKRIAVFGTNANSVIMLVGNYHGEPSRPVTILEGIQTLAGTNIEVTFDPGCPLALGKSGKTSGADNWTNALAEAAAADVVIYVGGIHAKLEGEEMRVNFDGFSGGDRTRIELPPVQSEFIQALSASGKPVIFVNCSGSAMAMPWEVEHLPAILQAWYPGEQGGRAVAEVLFGAVNPAGRLPVTFYRSTDDLPAFRDYSMSNRTYRYFSGMPEYAFGHGLSYTTFAYTKPNLDQSAVNNQDTVKVSFNVQNSGLLEGDEVAQVYFRHVHSAVEQPRQALCGFSRVHLLRNQSADLTVSIPTERFRYWDTTQKRYIVEAGDYELLIGSGSDDIRLKLPLTIRAAN